MMKHTSPQPTVKKTKKRSVKQVFFLTATGLMLLWWACSCGLFSSPACTVRPAAVCLDPAAIDQDDMCLWVHPSDPALSTVIVADKKAYKLFVYDLQGTTLQALDVPKPGNIDLR